MPETPSRRSKHEPTSDGLTPASAHNTNKWYNKSALSEIMCSLSFETAEITVSVASSPTFCAIRDRPREKSFAEGLSTADEVNDARTKLLGAQIARRVAAYRFVAAWAALNGIAGTMHEFESSANRSDNIFER